MMTYNDFINIYSDEINYDEELESTYNAFYKRTDYIDIDDIINTDDLIY